MRALRIALWCAVGIALFVLGALTVGGLSLRDADAMRTGSGSELEPGAPLGGAFALLDHRGEPVTQAIFRGKPSVTLFGFTHCPDVCPTSLMQMGRWAEQLGADADKLRFIFVTVDPERDTPAVLTDYVTAFSERIVGVTGEPEAVHAMVKDYKIYSARTPLDGGGYTMDHTALVYLMDKQGKFVAPFNVKRGADAAAADLRKYF